MTSRKGTWLLPSFCFLSLPFLTWNPSTTVGHTFHMLFKFCVLRKINSWLVKITLYDNLDTLSIDVCKALWPSFISTAETHLQWQWLMGMATSAEREVRVKGLSSGSSDNRTRGKRVSEAAGEWQGNRDLLLCSGHYSPERFMVHLSTQRAFLFPLCFLCWESGTWGWIAAMPLHRRQSHLFSATFSQISIYKHRSWTETLHKTRFLTGSLGCVSHSCVQYMNSLTANTLKASQTRSQLVRLATCCSLKTSGMLATLSCRLVPLAGMGWPRLISRTKPHLQYTAQTFFLVLYLGLGSILTWRASGFCNGQTSCISMEVLSICANPFLVSWVSCLTVWLILWRLFGDGEVE